MTGNERVLANIIYSRGLQGEYAVKLTPREAEAFGIKIESDTMFCADVLGNKVSIIPLCSPEEYK